MKKQSNLFIKLLNWVFLIFITLFTIGCDLLISDYPDDTYQVNIYQALEESYIEYAIGDSQESVTQDIKFVNCKDFRYDYKWESSNEDVIDNLGNVNQLDKDFVVKITLTISSPELRLYQIFYLNVKKEVIKEDGYTYDLENVKSALSLFELNDVKENEEYTNHLDVIAYIHKYHKLPSNYKTKSEAKAIGWTKGIGGDTFQNREQELPIVDANTYIEVDVNFSGNNRGSHRIVYNRYTFDIYYTDDHYQSFTYMIGEKK